MSFGKSSQKCSPTHSLSTLMNNINLGKKVARSFGNFTIFHKSDLSQISSIAGLPDGMFSNQKS
jgi:hypothetical protein